MEKQEAGPDPVGEEVLQIKQRIANGKADKKTDAFDPGASALETDSETGAMPGAEGMALARKAPKS